MTDAVQLAKSVLAADGQPFTTLSLAQGLPPVTADTPVADARRSYMRLAGLIHPDRLQSSFDQATEAFQCLVRAFECFADPKSRKKAAAEVAKKAKAEKPATKAGKGKAPSVMRGQGEATSTISPKSAKAVDAKKAAKADKKSKKATTEKASSKRKPSKKKAAKAEAPSEEDEEESEEEDESDAEGSDDASAAEEDAWEEWAAADAEPEVSTSRTPIGQQRLSEVYKQTTIGCPKCRSAWEPDSRPQYSLFMGHWGKKVHCQLCLFHFGCATALHSCPHCSAPFDYDVSMYDEVQTCTKCKKKFGFAYFPVNQHLIDQIALEEWRERKDREKAAEREARARARRGETAQDDEAESEKTQLLVGSCIVNEQCPLCHHRVKSQHRSHVLTCLKQSPEERKAAGEVEKKKGTKAGAASDKVVSPKAAPKTSKAVAKPKPKKTAAAAKAAPKKAAPKKAAPTQRKRRRGGSSSDDESSESEASMSDDDDEDESESSLSDEDDDSD